MKRKATVLYTVRRYLLERRGLLAGMGVLLVASGLLVSWALRQVDLKEVRVRGVRYIQEEEIQERAAISKPQKIFALSESAIENRVARHPWVEKASVIRWINGVLEIQIHEREPVLLALNEEGRVHAYLDRNGHVMPWRPGVMAPVPVYRGALPDSLPASLRMLLHVLGEDEEARHLLAEVEMTRTGMLRVQTIPTALQSGIPVLLGDRDIPEKWQYLKAFWKQVVVQRPERVFEHVDLRFADQVITREKTINSR